MNKPKLKLAHIWPGLYVVPSTKEERPEPSPSEGACLPPTSEHGPLVAKATVSHPSRPKGSYCLRRRSRQMVRSVYLTRVLQRLEKGYEDEGDAFLSELALVWVSGDGSREVALKGRALRELVEGPQDDLRRSITMGKSAVG